MEDPNGNSEILTPANLLSDLYSIANRPEGIDWSDSSLEVEFRVPGHDWSQLGYVRSPEGDRFLSELAGLIMRGGEVWDCNEVTAEPDQEA